MRHSGLHRFAVIAVALTTAALLVGAMETSSGNGSFRDLHLITAGVSAAVTAILALWMMRDAKLRGKGAAILGLSVAEAALGLVANNVAIATVHALIAPVLLAAAMAAVVVTGRRWQEPAERVVDQGWPSLKSLSNIVLVMVLIQIVLGAAFRHKEMGVLSHLFFAMVLVLVILCLSIFVMQQFPDHKGLRPAANMLMAVAFTQIFLGIAAFTVRSMTTVAMSVMIGVTALHVVVGAITLGAALMLHLHIGRNVERKNQEAE